MERIQRGPTPLAVQLDQPCELVVPEDRPITLLHGANHPGTKVAQKVARDIGSGVQPTESGATLSHDKAFHEKGAHSQGKGADLKRSEIAGDISRR